VNWNKLLSAKRFGLENSIVQKPGIARTQFQRDYDRILFSSAFRRLQNKTQVFPLPGTIFVHNRLTHSLEVASVGRSLGNLVADKILENNLAQNVAGIKDIEAIVAAGCLAHDLGNPPFGHSGEDAISNYFKTKSHSKIKDNIKAEEWNDLLNFEGNANALRLITHQLKGRRKGGFALTYSTIASVIKYPYSSNNGGKKKYGYFQSEKETFNQIINELGIKLIDPQKEIFARHPLVYLVEAADDICYQVMDLEDAHKLKIISYDETKQLFINFFHKEIDKTVIENIENTFRQVTDKNEQIAYLRALIINKLVHNAATIFWNNYNLIMQGEFKGSLIKNLDKYSQKAMNNLIQISIDKIYKHKSVVEIEIAGYKIIGSLLEEFIEALINPVSNYSKSLLSLIPEQFSLNSGNLYLNIRSVLDFISGMTDGYALNLYRKIRGINLPEFR